MLVAGGQVATSGSGETHQGAIVFTPYFEAGGDSALCFADPEGDRTAILRVFKDQRASVPVWSPNGRQIAFTLDGEIRVMDADGSNMVFVTSGTHPSWSPDGAQLAFEYQGEIKLIGSDGSAERTIATGRNPDWSPDGDRILFDQIPEPQPTDGPEGELKSIDLAGEGLRDHGTGLDAAWSPSGTEIAFTDQDYWRSVIRVMNEDGSGYRAITEEAYGQSRPALPAWSPDGVSVLFLRDGEVWAVDTDGTTPRRILRSGGPADWGVPLDSAGVLEGRACETPRRFVSLDLRGHLFARGKVWTNYRRLCSIEDVEITVWRKTRTGFRLAGSSDTAADGTYSMELKVHGNNGREPDRPGRYQAQMNSAVGCERSRSALKAHSH